MCFEALPVFSCGCPHTCGTIQILTGDAPNCVSILTDDCPSWFPLYDQFVPTMYTYTWDNCAACQQAIHEGKERDIPDKAGCFSCQIRRVKCGMEKPFCLKCTIPGRNCEGYPLVPEVLPPPLPFRPRKRLFGGVDRTIGRVASQGPVKNSVTDEGGRVYVVTGYGLGNVSWRDWVLAERDLEELENEIEGLVASLKETKMESEKVEREMGELSASETSSR